MKLAVISDIHGNLDSLDVVLASIESCGVRQVVCLGDVAEMGPKPHETLQRLMELKCITIRGNEDEALLNSEAPREYQDDIDRKIHDVDKWTAKQLTQADFSFLRSFKPTVSVNLPGSRALLLCHGSPRSNTEGITAESPRAEELEKILSGANRPFLVACGHTHAQMLRSHLGTTFVFNPGSVGLPFYYRSVADARNQVPRFPLRAEWAVLDVEDERASVQFHQARVDSGKVVQSIRESGMPHGDWMVEHWEARRRSPGRV